MAPLTERSPLTQDLNHAIFAMLIIGGHVCFPFMLSCIFISRNPLSRSLLFLHFCFTWVLHSVGFSILFYSGNTTGPEPSFIPCVMQAVLVHVAPVIESSFLCALDYHLFSTLEAVLKSKPEKSELTMMALIAGPYFVSLVPTLIVCVVAMSQPEVLYRGDNYYCSVWLRPVTYINAVLVGILLCISVFLEYRIALLLTKNRLVLKQVTVQGFGLPDLLIRLSLFMFITVTSVAMVLVTMVDRMNKSRIVYQAALPLLAFLTFGTRPSFYRLKHRKMKTAEDERPSAECRAQTAEVI